MTTIPHITDATAADTLNVTGPVLIAFGASWCAPCKAMAPHLERLAVERHGKLTVVKADTEQAPNTAGRYRVRGLPTLVMLKDGAVLASRPGSASYDDLTKWVDGVLVEVA